ncbi:MAG: hypothetical protein KatS3mg052_1002 [Candidatus Roseilinea sp.]|nr:MAG: hypothetical protein KatS3mg052_1002 [Candidatus Roseilinea sp.]
MNTKLYVGNLPFDTSEDALRERFTQAGAIVSVTIPLDRMTNRPRGFAFVGNGKPPTEPAKPSGCSMGRTSEGAP